MLPQLLRVQNLGGLVFTIPYKARACALRRRARRAGARVGAINALGARPRRTLARRHLRRTRLRGSVSPPRHRARRQARDADRRRRRGLRDRGGRRRRAAGNAAIYDVDARARAARWPARSRAPSRVPTSRPDRRRSTGIDVLLNATPVGMLADARLPFAVDAAAARARRVRRDREAGAHAAPRARRALRLHDGARARDDARPDRAHGRLLLRVARAYRRSSVGGRHAGIAAFGARRSGSCARPLRGRGNTPARAASRRSPRPGTARTPRRWSRAARRASTPPPRSAPTRCSHASIARAMPRRWCDGRTASSTRCARSSPNVMIAKPATRGPSRATSATVLAVADHPRDAVAPVFPPEARTRSRSRDITASDCASAGSANPMGKSRQAMRSFCHA